MTEEIKKAYSELRNYAFSLNRYTQYDAEDLLQDTILKMIEKIDMYNEQSGKSIVNWGMTIMHNIHVNKLRAKKYFVPDEVLKYIPTDSVIERDNTMKECKEKLKDKKSFMEVFILRKFGLSYDEITNFLGVQSGTTKARIHFMKKHLCEKL